MSRDNLCRVFFSNGMMVLGHKLLITRMITVYVYPRPSGTVLPCSTYHHMCYGVVRLRTACANALPLYHGFLRAAPWSENKRKRQKRREDKKKKIRGGGQYDMCNSNDHPRTDGSWRINATRSRGHGACWTMVNAAPRFSLFFSFLFSLCYLTGLTIHHPPITPSPTLCNV
jgi:hypothetical protein